MKYLLPVALVLSTVSCGGGLLLKQDTLDDIDFMDQMFYNMYNGFVRGLYREHTHKIVDDKCFGDWIKNDMVHLDSVMEKVFNLQFPIAYEDAMKSATELVNLFYMNQQYCSAYKIWDDVNAACDGDLLNCMDMNVLMENGKKNMIQIFTRGQDIFQLLLKADVETDEEILSAIDRLGEDYGALLSYIIGFDKRFENSNESHKHTKLRSSSSRGILKNLF